MQLFQSYIQEKTENLRKKLIEQQQLIQQYLSAFEDFNVTNPLMGDFMNWAENQSPDFRYLLNDFLNSLNIDTTDIQKLPLTSLYSQLEHISLGDDITLHIESVSDMRQSLVEEGKSLVIV